MITDAKFVATTVAVLTVTIVLLFLFGGGSTLDASISVFLGALVAASIGFLALLCGALLNAHYQRRENERVREEQNRGQALALLVELDPRISSLIQVLNPILGANSESEKSSYLSKHLHGSIQEDVKEGIRVFERNLDRFASLPRDANEHLARAVLAFHILHQGVERLPRGDDRYITQNIDTFEGAAYQALLSMLRAKQDLIHHLHVQADHADELKGLISKFQKLEEQAALRLQGVKE